MPRKKVPTGGATIVVNPPQSEQEDQDKTVEEQEVENVMAHVDSEALTRVDARIMRRHPATGNKETLTDTVDAELVSAEFLKDNYGGGSYRVQYIGPMPGKAGKPGRGIMKTLRFDIDATIPPKHPRASMAMAAGEQSPHNTSPLDMAVVTMLTTMMQNMATQAQQQAEANRAMTTMQMQMMRDHSTMLAAQLNELAKGRNERDPFDMVKDIAGLIKPEPTRTLKDELETLQMLRELTGDKDGGETTWLDVVRDVAPGFLAAAAKRDGVAVPEGRSVPGVRRPGRVPPVPPVVHSGPVLSGPTPDGASIGEAVPQGGAPSGDIGVNNENLKFVAPIVPRLIKMAGQGRPPALCAEWILGEIPEGFYPMLREQLSADTLLDDVMAAFPAAVPIRAWISEFRDAMLGLMDPDGEDDPDEEPDDDDGAQME